MRGYGLFTHFDRWHLKTVSAVLLVLQVAVTSVLPLRPAQAIEPTTAIAVGQTAVGLISLFSGGGDSALAMARVNNELLKVILGGQEKQNEALKIILLQLADLPQTVREEIRRGQVDAHARKVSTLGELFFSYLVDHNGVRIPDEKLGGRKQKIERNYDKLSETLRELTTYDPTLTGYTIAVGAFFVLAHLDAFEAETSDRIQEAKFYRTHLLKMLDELAHRIAQETADYRQKRSELYAAIGAPTDCERPDGTYEWYSLTLYQKSGMVVGSTPHRMGQSPEFWYEELIYADRPVHTFANRRQVTTTVVGDPQYRITTVAVNPVGVTDEVLDRHADAATIEIKGKVTRAKLTRVKATIDARKRSEHADFVHNTVEPLNRQADRLIALLDLRTMAEHAVAYLTRTIFVVERGDSNPEPDVLDYLQLCNDIVLSEGSTTKERLAAIAAAERYAVAERIIAAMAAQTQHASNVIAQGDEKIRKAVEHDERLARVQRAVAVANVAVQLAATYEALKADLSQSTPAALSERETAEQPKSPGQEAKSGPGAGTPGASKPQFSVKKLSGLDKMERIEQIAAELGHAARQGKVTPQMRARLANRALTALVLLDTLPDTPADIAVQKHSDMFGWKSIAQGIGLLLDGAPKDSGTSGWGTFARTLGHIAVPQPLADETRLGRSHREQMRQYLQQGLSALAAEGIEQQK